MSKSLKLPQINRGYSFPLLGQVKVVGFHCCQYHVFRS
uniref:Uncharacterized protein n=1 Tax=Lepeophtheirus salmonis TaxID=72036 RepID=A0A0K2V4T5_LEPSM